MIYRQNTQYLRYGEYPFSSSIHAYDGENGYQKFCQPHNHMAIEIARVLDGTFQMQVNGETIQACEGDILFFSPLDIHMIWSDVACTMQVIIFDLSLVENQAHEQYREVIRSLGEGTSKFTTVVRSDAPLAALLAPVMDRMRENHATRANTGSFLRIVAGLYEMLALLYDEGAIIRAPKETDKNATTALFAKNVVRYVSENYASAISTKDAARALHLDKSYFCRAFRSVFDQTFVDYLHEYRISVAKNLKPENSRTLGDIAEAVGYASYDAFAIQFKKYVGMTPKAYFCKYASVILS